ncbi:hypothetical protein BO94DRAFT_242178 [Aspergillus sclerotioniger CBS 115572]|uniref:Uncharacterized protein n=1 Tax=Aspergillus sclerotioniger CBS 115572 TaxID=1450535 RepID=A0A317VI77_9EURO|nr:hypothetical protein BO94DRAFT_242178 [Aspergillus sclerotioniger CBS 115572]PWY73169.1 hypothetical protein BO94DRAFT_242178 [Aspergillus sclerotioniger CBS 115572]
MYHLLFTIISLYTSTSPVLKKDIAPSHMLGTLEGKNPNQQPPAPSMGPWLGGFSLFRLPGMTSGGALFPRNRVTAVAANRWRKQRMGQIEFPRSRLLLRQVGPLARSLGGRRRRAPKRCAHFSWFGPYTEDYDRAEYDGREGREEPGKAQANGRQKRVGGVVARIGRLAWLGVDT